MNQHEIEVEEKRTGGSSSSRDATSWETAVVTGGCGFIGRYLAEALAELGKKVENLNSNNPSF